MTFVIVDCVITNPMIVIVSYLTVTLILMTVIDSHMTVTAPGVYALEVLRVLRC